MGSITPDGVGGRDAGDRSVGGGGGDDAVPGADRLGPLDIHRLVSAARSEEAVLRRGRQQWLRQQAAEEATWAGVLLDLAEAGEVVTVACRSGRAHRGLVCSVGRDHLAVAAEPGRAGGMGSGEAVSAFVAFAAVVAVHQRSPGGPCAGDRRPDSGVTLVQVLADLAGRREQVRLVTAGGDTLVAGTLGVVGRDVVGVRVGSGDGVSYVQAAKVDEVLLA